MALSSAVVAAVISALAASIRAGSAGVNDDKNVAGLNLTTFDSRHLARRAADLGR